MEGARVHVHVQAGWESPERTTQILIRLKCRCCRLAWRHLVNLGVLRGDRSDPDTQTDRRSKSGYLPDSFTSSAILWVLPLSSP